MEIREWIEVLKKDPDCAPECNVWDEFDGADWSSLLSVQPCFAEKCDWDKLIYRGFGLGGRMGWWVNLLSAQPQFADKCDFRLFDKYEWIDLLRVQPHLADKRDWNRLGEGVLRMELAGDPADTHSIVLLGGATLINTSRVPPHGSGFNYCVGEHCYVNLKALPPATKLEQGSHWTSHAGNAFIRCGGPDCVADLLSDVDLALWDDTPIVHDEYFGKGEYAKRPGLARYFCENGDYFEAMGVQRQDLITRLSDAFGSTDWLAVKNGGKKRPLVCIGAIIGNIIASRFGHSNPKTKDFELFVPECRMTADGSMTVAVMAALLAARNDPERLASCTVRALRTFGRLNHDEFGALFQKWIFSPDPQPYGSWGNGAAMRVSPCAWAARSLDEALELARTVTGVTHNHSEGIRGAEAVTAAIFLARQGCSQEEIRDYVQKNYYPNLTFILDEIRDSYDFDSSCQGSVPQALEAFFEADSFESAIRNAVSIGGDVDTIAAIAGSIAEAKWGVPTEIVKSAQWYIEKDFMKISKGFLSFFC